MSKRPFTVKTIAVPDCQVGEDIVFSEDNKTWYLTCMGSAKVIIGDGVTDQPTKTVSLPKPYPHGIAVHNGIDRLLLTETVRATDLKDAGETVTVVEASTGNVLGTHKVSNKPSPAGEAPVEVLFVPGAIHRLLTLPTCTVGHCGRRPGTRKKRILMLRRCSIFQR